MRSRFLTRLTNSEVENYLEFNDLIYIPVGTVETHGGMPLDCETVLPEAFALRFAEVTDGLVLPNLPYFYPGATQVGRGTVHVSIAAGAAYLDKIARSLLTQGFRRQVYVSGHGPANLTIEPMIQDFFHDTKVPIMYLDLAPRLAHFVNEMPVFYDVLLGAYLLLSRLEDVPLNFVQNGSPGGSTNGDDRLTTPEGLRFTEAITSAGGTFGYYYSAPTDHGHLSPILKTANEREERARAGLRMIDGIVADMALPAAVEALRKLDEYTRETVLPRYGPILPCGSGQFAPASPPPSAGGTR